MVALPDHSAADKYTGLLLPAGILVIIAMMVLPLPVV